MFIPDAGPVFSGNVCGTAPSCLKPSATRRGMIIFQCNFIVIMFAVCYECVMKALWKCYESVMDVLWMCYGCVMGVLWVCEVCYGRVKDVCVMDKWWIFYLLCKLYCKGYCNCDIVIVCDITVMLIFVFCFSGLFIWRNKYMTPRRSMCSFYAHYEPATCVYQV